MHDVELNVDRRDQLLPQLMTAVVYLDITLHTPFPLPVAGCQVGLPKLDLLRDLTVYGDVESLRRFLPRLTLDQIERVLYWLASPSQATRFYPAVEVELRRRLPVHLGAHRYPHRKSTYGKPLEFGAVALNAVTTLVVELAHRGRPGFVRLLCRRYPNLEPPAFPTDLLHHHTQEAFEAWTSERCPEIDEFIDVSVEFGTRREWLQVGRNLASWLGSFFWPSL